MDTTEAQKYDGWTPNMQHNTNALTLDMVVDTFLDDHPKSDGWFGVNHYDFLFELAEFVAKQRDILLDDALQRTNKVLEKRLSDLQGYADRLSERNRVLNGENSTLREAQNINLPGLQARLGELETGYRERGEKLVSLEFQKRQLERKNIISDAMLRNMEAMKNDIEYELTLATAEADRLDDELTLATAEATRLNEILDETLAATAKLAVRHLQLLATRFGGGEQIFGFSNN